MTAYFVRRIAISLVTLLGVATIVFMSIHISGDPALLMLPPEASEHDIAIFRHAMGFDQPLITQFFSFLVKLFKGDLGTSLRYGQPALSVVLGRLPATLLLACSGLFIVICLALPAGIYTALRPNSIRSNAIGLFVVAGQAIPTFWIGLMLILLFSVNLRWFPAFGYGTFSHLVLPSVTLALYYAAINARLLRSSLLEVLCSDYIRTARSKGIGEFRVIAKHALKNASVAIVTVLGLQLAQLLGGAVVTEIVFAWPGVGKLVVQSVYARDFPVVQAAVLFIACGYIVINLMVDLLYCVLDPRIRLN